MPGLRSALVTLVFLVIAAGASAHGGGGLKAVVTPISNSVTYSIAATASAPALDMFVGYTVLIKNESYYADDDVDIVFSLSGPASAGMTLSDPGTYLPSPACTPVTGGNSFKCAIGKLKGGATFPASGQPFVVFYRAPNDTGLGTTSITSKVKSVDDYSHYSYYGGSTSTDIGGASIVNLGTPNNVSIKTALPKTGGTLRTGAAGIPTSTNKATELLFVPPLPGSTITYAPAALSVDLSATDGSGGGAADPDCLTQGHFKQCPVYSTSIPNPTSGAPLQFTSSAPLSMVYRIHPTNLKMSASKILNSTLIFYKADGAYAFQQVTAICPSSSTSTNSGVPCIAVAQCYTRGKDKHDKWDKNNPDFNKRGNGYGHDHHDDGGTTPGWTPELDGVCEWKLNNIKNGLLKLE